eukprot:7640183-Heterocapsa_arctica.AAC.1
MDATRVGSVHRVARFRIVLELCMRGIRRLELPLVLVRGVLDELLKVFHVLRQIALEGAMGLLHAIERRFVLLA